MEEDSNVFRFWDNWGQALSEESPCGEDVCFSPEFETLKAEVDKSASLHASERPDWHLVRQLASELLATQSKDIWAFVYAVYATCQIDGIGACSSAIAALTRVLETYWDGLYPSLARMQRRLAPLQWLCERLGHLAEGTGFMDENPEAVSALRTDCSALQDFLNEIERYRPIVIGRCHRKRARFG